MRIRVRMATLLLAASMFHTAYGQLSAPTTEAVYGGRVNWIDAVDLGSVTRIFIATESANSMFWTDVDPTDATTISGSYGFQTVLSFDADDGFGSGISRFAGHGTSGWVYVVDASGALYGTDPAAEGRTTLASVGVSTVAVEGDQIFFVAQGGSGGFTLEGGALDATGGYTSSGPGLDLSACGFTTAPSRLVVSPADGVLYFFAEGMPGGAPTLCKSSDAYNLISGTTTFSALSVSGVTTESGQTYSAFGMGPDGRIFVGRTTGSAPGTKYVAYTDDDGATWTNLDTGVTGVAGSNIAASGPGPYTVYFGTAVSTGSGASGTWSVMPTVGSPTQPHGNDGATVIDPNNGSVAYLTTDVAFGMTPDDGQNLMDLNDGIVAVQVNDFDMDAGKTYGWLAAKAGIFHVSDYATASETWSHAFPNGDGSPYYAIAMDLSDATGQTAWAGNTRVYRTADGGGTWSRLFAIEDNGYQGGQFAFSSFIDAIAVHPNDPNVVFVGIHSPDSGVRGGIYYTEDGGATWTQVSTDVGGTTYNVEVTDLLLVPGTGSDATVYAAAEYVSDGTTSSYGVKVVDYVAGSGVTFTNDMNGTSGVITNFGGNDLAVNDADGSVWTCGQNSSGEPRVYRLASGSATWDLMPTAGLPTAPGCTALTIGVDSGGNDVPYVAVGAQVYFNPVEGSGDDETTGSWLADPALTYPAGMEINVLFWDELLVGTGAGLYGHEASTPLPVELATFEAAADGRDVALTWTTASETNNAGFEVQRFDDGWRTLAFVEGRGAAAEAHTYGYRVTGLDPGTHRFRLKQIDFDGTFAFSPEVEVRVALPDAFFLAAYPNPFNPETTLRLAAPETQRVRVAVYDLLGRRVALLHEGRLAGGETHTFRFDGGGLPSGLYVIRVDGEHFRAARTVTLVK